MANPQGNGRFDVGQQKIAAVYAKALLGAHETTCKSEGLAEELGALVELLDQHPTFEQILASPLTKSDEQVARLERVLGDRVSPELLVFLKVLADHGRLDTLRAVRHEFQRQLNQAKGRIDVEVRTPLPLEASLQQEIAAKLQQKLGLEPVLRMVEAPELIGGFVIRVGDTVYDSSVATQLQRARGEMIDRSVELIETKRQHLVG